MKIVAISDLHSKHRQITIPEGDVLICAGDISKRGEPQIIQDFIDWMRDLPHRKKILIFGNHELGMDKVSAQKIDTIKYIEESNLIYLENSGIEIDGIYFWGSPHTPIWHSQWAFNLPRDSDELKQKWASIPDNTNVLITHGPPYQILDEAPRGFLDLDYEHTGCKYLANRIKQLQKLKAHIFGHIHPARGVKEIDNTFYINASICDDRHNPINAPFVFEI